MVIENIDTSAERERELRSLLLERLSGGGETSSLSAEQQRIWFLRQLDASVPVNSHLAVAIDGELDFPALQQALVELTRQHKILRTVFIELDGRPVRVVTADVKLVVPVFDLSDETEKRRRDETELLARRDAQRPFDLKTAPLLAASLIRESATRHILLLTADLIVADRESLRVLLAQLTREYADMRAGSAGRRAAAVQFDEIVTWERTLVDKEDLLGRTDWWRECLADLPTIELPTDYRRPRMKTVRCGLRTARLDGPLAAELSAVGGGGSEGLATAVLAAYTVVLGRFAGEDDFGVGVAVPQRTAEWSLLVGPLSNWTVVRMAFPGGLSFRELTGRIAAARRQAEQNAVPFQHLVDTLDLPKDTSRTPLFQAGFQVAEPVPVTAAGGCTFGPVELDVGTTTMDLELRVAPGSDGAELALEYNTDLFKPDSAESLLRQVTVLLNACATEPQSDPYTMPLLGEQERETILRTWNDTARPYPSQRLLHELVVAQVQRTPDACAVACGGREVTYVQLNGLANGLAMRLREVGVGPERPVAVMVERSIESVVALLAVLKAGGAYLPVDPSFPPSRIAFILADANVAAVVAPRALANAVPRGDWSVIVPDDRTAAEPPTADITPDNLAYLIYTSGSTGEPKGVLVSHRNAVHATSARYDRLPEPDGGYVMLAPFFFDASVGGIYWVLSRGGTLVVPTEAEVLDPRQLARLVEQRQPSHIDCVPSQYEILLSTPNLTAPRLRCCIVAGEALPVALATMHYQRFPDVPLFNEYGPTEATIWSTVYEVPADLDDAGNGTVPIGRPIPNATAYVLDDRGEPVPVGVPGELFIGGLGVTRGYANRPDQTASRFRPDPFTGVAGGRMYRSGDLVKLRPDGVLEFLGRADTQVKLRGFRVELGEIENLLRAHPAVRAAAVQANEEASGDVRLYAYVDSAPGYAADARELASYLVGRLPQYMVPARFVFLAGLPLTRAGKLDRRKLNPLAAEASDAVKDRYVPPQTVVEEDVAAVFSELLGTERVGLHDDFFELGGNSLLIARLVARLWSTYDVEVPLERFFEVPTVSFIARVIGEYQRGERTTPGPDSEEWEQVRADVLLDEAITPDGLPLAGINDPRNVMLTGATGYLGGFLLEAVLRGTDWDAYCLVRAEDAESGLARIVDNLKGWEIWDPAFEERIHPVPGNLALPRLGLTEAAFAELAATVDAIYHNGAAVNFVFPYSELRKPNVLGTVEVIRLACTTRLKALHYVSTMDVFMGTHASRPYYELDLPRELQQLPGGYPRSKWASEKLIAAARDRGVPTAIYRPWLIVSNPRTGASQTTDYMLLAAKGYLEIGMLPKIDEIVNAVSVDWASQALLYLSRQPSSFGRIFHFGSVNPQSWDQVYDWFRSYGYKFDVVPYHEVRDAVRSLDPSHPVYRLLPLFPETFDTHPEMSTGTQQTLNSDDELGNTLRALEGSGLEVPMMGREMAHQCIDFMVRRGFFASPDAQGRQLGKPVEEPFAL